MPYQPSTHEVQRNTATAFVEDESVIVTLPTFGVYGEHITTLIDLLDAIGCEDEATIVRAAAEGLISLPTARDVEVLDAEWHEAFDALNAADMRHDADDPIAARYRAASDAINHANRQREARR